MASILVAWRMWHLRSSRLRQSYMSTVGTIIGARPRPSLHTYETALGLGTAPVNPHYANTMAAYNRWMNDRLYEACSKASDEQRRKDLGAFFKSMHGTLNHLLLADRIWLGRFSQKPFQATSLNQELYSKFDELREQRDQTDRDITEWAISLRDSDFGGTLHYVSIVDPQPRSCPFDIAVVHFFNHQTHHRGQLTTLLMQSGIDPGITDLIALALPR